MIQTIKNLDATVNARRMTMLALGATLLTWVCVLWFGFVWDDFPTVVTNGSLSTLGGVFSSFRSDFWGLHLVPEWSGYYRPFATVVYGCTRFVFGQGPFGFHLVNLVLHVGNVFWLCRLIESTSLSRLSKMWIVFFFALHPIHAETVSFISALPDLLSAFFGLGFLVLWRPTLERGQMRQWLGALFWALSLLSKESAIIFGCFWFIQSARHKTKFDIGLLFGVWLTYVLAHRYATPQTFHHPLWGGNWIAHWVTVGRVFFYSLFLTLLPVSTTPTRTVEVGGTWLQLWIPWLALALGLFFYLVRKSVRWKNVGLGGLLFVLAWLPTSNLIPLEGLMADRYLYLCVIGIAVATSLLVDRFRWATLLAPVFLSTMAATAFVQAAHWKNEESLWSHAVHVSPQSSVALNEWGRIQLSKHEDEEAKKLFEKALALQPEHVEARLNLALVLLKHGESQGAKREIETVLRRWPNHAEALNAMGNVANELGNLDEALEWSKRAVIANPTHWKYQYQLGTAYLQRGEYHEAVAPLLKARSLVPQDARVLNNLAAAYVGEKRWREAEEVYLSLLEIKPTDEVTLRNLTIVQQGMK